MVLFTVVCGAVECEMPLFSQIESLLAIDGKLLLLTFPLFTLSFQEHFHAFKVKSSKEGFVVFWVDSLPYPRPFDIQMSYGGNAHISLFHIALSGEQ